MPLIVLSPFPVFLPISISFCLCICHQNNTSVEATVLSNAEKTLFLRGGEYKQKN